MCFLNKVLVLAFLYCIFSFSILSCTKINCPFEHESEQNTSDIIFKSWPDTLSTSGIGVPNPNLPLAAQRYGAIRAAKLDLFRNLLTISYSLSISSTQTIEDLIEDNDMIQTEVEGYVKNFTISDTLYLSTEDIKLMGYIETAGLKVIVEPYI